MTNEEKINIEELSNELFKEEPQVKNDFSNFVSVGDYVDSWIF